ncbi:putative B3 domain-containing protein At3g24850 [Beta vulgaris subsp. vulgaris]|uniref:putative B3 domain-containing protein At3g24850 n=1 Tax=Beta vulgaris subsp. vulgaris TaxID=3555 RepID=UPI0025486587|nr:putative B3 domain-containing protein At3g24850 [Beta vulgaris subsp. vulgaris]
MEGKQSEPFRLFGFDIVPSSSAESCTTATYSAAHDNADANPNASTRMEGKQSQTLKLFGADIIVALSSTESSSTYPAGVVHDIASTSTHTDRANRQHKRKRSSEIHQNNNNMSVESQPRKERRRKPSKEHISLANLKPPNLDRELLEEVRNLGGGDDPPKLVIQKYVFYSDVAIDQARFQIPRKKIEGKGILTAEEEDQVFRDHLCGKMDVTVLLQTKEIFGNMRFKRWPLPQPSETKVKWNCVLQKGWNEVAKKIGLKEGNYLQVWAFRHGEQRKKLGFILVKLTKEQLNEAQ